MMMFFGATSSLSSGGSFCRRQRGHRIFQGLHSSSTEMRSFVYTQMAAAIRIASSTICLASRSECAIRARAAARAKGPPEPIPITPSSGSITSPVPERMKERSWSATARRASRRRRTRSVRQSLASSTAARDRFPRYSSRRASNFSKRAKASAGVPPEPPGPPAWENFLTLCAPPFTLGGPGGGRAAGCGGGGRGWVDGEEGEEPLGQPRRGDLPRRVLGEPAAASQEGQAASDGRQLARDGGAGEAGLVQPRQVLAQQARVHLRHPADAPRREEAAELREIGPVASKGVG